MEYTIFKICDGDIELVKGDVKIILTNKNSSVTLSDDEYWDLMDDKQHLVRNGMVYVSQIPVVVEEKKSKKDK